MADLSTEEGVKEFLGDDSGSQVLLDHVVWYIAGVITRERHRLARIVADAGGDAGSDLADAIVSKSYDREVFQFEGPGTRLKR